jgi:hypothetical protein
MLCCYGVVLSKNRKSTTIQPFTNVSRIRVYENKKRIRSVYPNNSEYTINYDKNGVQIN